MLYKRIIDYEKEHGTIPNNIYGDGSVNDVWSPEVANYEGGLYIPITEGILLGPFETVMRCELFMVKNELV